MPTPEALAAFSHAQKIVGVMLHLNEREHVLSETINRTTDRAAREVLEDELVKVCSEWTRLHGEYVKAFAEYTSAVVRSR